MRLDPQTLQAMQLVSGLGCSIAVCLGGGILAGFWADQRLHTKPWLVLAGILLGLAGSGAIIYNLMIAVSKRTKPDEPSEKSKPDGSA